MTRALSIRERTSGSAEWLERLETEAHLWLARPQDWAEGEFLQSSQDVLTPAELERLRRMRHPVPYGLHLTARALLRRTLSRYADIEPGEWRFNQNPHGRPELDLNALPQCPPLRFNMSHTDGLVACVVALDAECGIDTETTNRKLDPLAIARHSFTGAESETLRGLGEVERKDLFFRLWTLKEALLKAQGGGIALRLDSAGFELSPPGSIHLAFSTRENSGVALEDAHTWQLSLFKLDPNHYLSVALRPDSGSRLRPQFFQAMAGGQTPEALTVPPMATSG